MCVCNIEGFIRPIPVYARVDAIRCSQNTSSSLPLLSSHYYLLELELIEPELSFHQHENACKQILDSIYDVIIKM